MGKMYDEAMESISERMCNREKFIDYKKAKIRYGLGITTLREYAVKCGAIHHFGRAARIDVDIMDAYLKTFQG